MNDDQLHRLLRRYPAQIRLPKSFSRSVYARITAAESSRPRSTGLRRAGGALFTRLLRLLTAALLLALVLALGWGLSSWLFRVGQTADEKKEIRSITP
ncbi:MAG: hypothetical protein WAW39_30095 [Prosthecobacter sp.]|uniref:hypothetical protein n=1 Tax=Prosthecobacter sp. TaxID=1965333 RepID=UPI003BAF6973